MSLNHEHIKQLLQAARNAAQDTEDIQLPFSLQARVLTAWRAARLARERLELANVLRLLRLFRAGLGLACILMVLVVTFSLHRFRREPFYEIASPAPIINLALRP